MEPDDRGGVVLEAEGARVAVLHVDRDTALPLLYEYRADQRMFHTIGFVRMHGVMLPGVSHAGRDTDEDRDRFLLAVLTGLGVAPRAALRIVRNADHVSASEAAQGPAATRSMAASTPGTALPTTREPSLTDDFVELDGSHMAAPGAITGLLLGVVVGWILAAWNGAVIGAFIGSSTFPDLFTAGWQVVNARNPRNVVEIHDALALLLITVGELGGGGLGYVLGGDGFGRACGLFIGMSSAAFVLALVATTFSMVRFWQRAMVWLGPLLVGLFGWGAYTLWSTSASLAIGIVLGILVAAVPARRIAAHA